MATALRTLIVDDEPVARRVVRRALARHDDVDIIAEAVDGQDALRAIESLLPDLVFMDVQMPGMSGLEALAIASRTIVPLVVFVTAFDEFAIKAFDHAAIDYILKPVEQAHVDRAVTRARAQLHDLVPREGLVTLFANGRRSPDALADTLPLDRLVVTHGARVLVVSVADVDWLESNRNYVCVHAGPYRYSLRTTLHAIEARLNPQHFVRIHRSRLVNIQRVAEIIPEHHGDCLLVLRSGSRVRASRRYRSQLRL